MRRTVSFPDSQARLRVRIPGVPKADPSGSGERRSVRQMEGAVVAAAAGPSYRGAGQGRTRPDFSRRPTGRSLIPEKNVVEERRGSSAWPFSLPSLSPSHILFHFLTSCLASYHYSKAMEYLRGSISLKLILGYGRELPTKAGFSRNVYWRRRQVELISSQPSRAASPQRDEFKDRLSKKSHFTREIQEKFTDRETHSSPAPMNQESTYPSQQPITSKTSFKSDRKSPISQSKWKTLATNRAPSVILFYHFLTSQLSPGLSTLFNTTWWKMKSHMTEGMLSSPPFTSKRRKNV